MTPTGQRAPARFEPAGLIALAIYGLGAWASLAAVFYASTWQPVETIWKAGQVLALIVAGLALLMCVTGAMSRLLASAATKAPDRNPRP